MVLVKLEFNTLTSANKMFTVNLSFLKLKIVPDVFVFTLTQQCHVEVVSNRWHSSACRKLENLTAVVKTYLVFTHSQYIVICLLRFIFCNNEILTCLIHLPRLQIWNVFVFIRNIIYVLKSYAASLFPV